MINKQSHFLFLSLWIIIEEIIYIDINPIIMETGEIISIKPVQNRIFGPGKGAQTSKIKKDNNNNIIVNPILPNVGLNISFNLFSFLSVLIL